jgi:acyl-CoA thioester hydrolase
MTDGRVVEMTFFVRYAETDQMGVVHHSEYVVWFEEGRSAWIRAMGGNYADLEASGFDLAVSEVHARYVAPALYGRRVTVRSWVDELRSRALKFSYQVVDTESGGTLVTGYTRHVCVDAERRVVLIPKRWRELFSGVTQSDLLQYVHLRPTALPKPVVGGDGSGRHSAQITPDVSSDQ